MSELQRWWGNAVTAVADFLGRIFGQLYRGIVYDWNTMYFVLGAGAFLIIALTVLFWSRRN